MVEDSLRAGSPVKTSDTATERRSSGNKGRATPNTDASPKSDGLAAVGVHSNGTSSDGELGYETPGKGISGTTVLRQDLRSLEGISLQRKRGRMVRSNEGILVGDTPIIRVIRPDKANCNTLDVALTNAFKPRFHKSLYKPGTVVLTEDPSWVYHCVVGSDPVVGNEELRKCLNIIARTTTLHAEGPEDWELSVHESFFAGPRKVERLEAIKEELCAYGFTVKRHVSLSEGMGDNKNHA